MPLKKNVIIFPIFFECCQYADGDVYWENVFEDLAYGRAPYGAYISKNFLCCSYKKKEFNYCIEKKDPQILYREVRTLLTNKLGLISQRDKIETEKQFEQAEDNIKDTRKNWAKIRKKNMKELLIELFVIKMKKIYKLTVKQSQDLLSFIFIALILKVIVSDDVDYKDGEILGIEGISFSENQVIYTRDLCKIDIGHGNVVSSSLSMMHGVTIYGEEKKYMSDNWTKFIEKLSKMQKSPKGAITTSVANNEIEIE